MLVYKCMSMTERLTFSTCELDTRELVGVVDHGSAPWRRFDTISGRNESYKSPASVPSLQNPQIHGNNSLVIQNVTDEHVVFFLFFYSHPSANAFFVAGRKPRYVKFALLES